MKTKRLPKDVSEYYTSFEELRAAWNLKPVTKQTSDKSKLEKQREDFCKRHVCSACKKPMVYVAGVNMLVCQNPDCRGIKHEQKDTETGEVKIWYSPSYDLLNNKSSEIAHNLFK